MSWLSAAWRSPCCWSRWVSSGISGNWGQLPEQLFQPLLKTVCIALICRTGSDLCRDAGEGALASVLETAGAVAAIVVSLPLFRAVWDLLESLL